MDQIYTKDGEPLRLRGDDVFDKSGRHVGRRVGNKIYNHRGRYVATIDADRAVYRSTDRAGITSAFARHASIGRSALARAARSAIWGDEPTFD
jgi:hypothetical protein